MLFRIQSLVMSVSIVITSKRKWPCQPGKAHCLLTGQRIFQSRLPGSPASEVTGQQGSRRSFSMTSLKREAGLTAPGREHRTGALRDTPAEGVAENRRFEARGRLSPPTKRTGNSRPHRNQPMRLSATVFCCCTSASIPALSRTPSMLSIAVFQPTA